MFILCTYGDAVRWRSAIEPLLYPTGCSFYRTFSYKAAYIGESLLNAFRGDQGRLRELISDHNWNRGIFGMRFRTPAHHGRFIPLRYVFLTSPPKITDTIDLRFRLGDYFELPPRPALNAAPLDGIIDYDRVGETILMTEVPIEREEPFTTLRGRNDYPPGLLERYVDDASLPDEARNSFNGTTVLRLERVVDNIGNSELLPERLQAEKSYQTDFGLHHVRYATEYGYKLKKGKSYSFFFECNRIVTRETAQQQMIHDFESVGKGEDFDVSPIKIAVTGNYREERVLVEPRRERQFPIELQWLGVRKVDIGNIPSRDEEKIIGLRVPVATSARFWSTRKANGILALLFFVAMLAAFTKALLIELGRSGQPGVSSASPLTTILIAIGALSASAFTTFLNNFIKKE